MTETTPATLTTGFALPPSVVSKVDLSRLVRDLEAVDNQLTEAAVRAKTGMQVTAQPQITDRLRDFLSLNKLTLENSNQRTVLMKQLRDLKDNVPIIHMTFAVEADPTSLGQLTQWLRTSIHPQAVIAVGLQPGLIAGVYLRTPNHIHDLSLKSKLHESRGLLVKELEALRGSK